MRKVIPPHPKARAHPRTPGALNHTNDDHYSLELKGAVEVDSVIPFTRICPLRVVKPGALEMEVINIIEKEQHSTTCMKIFQITVWFSWTSGTFPLYG